MHLLSVCVASQIDFAEKETPFQDSDQQIESPGIQLHPFCAPGVQRPEGKPRIIFSFFQRPDIAREESSAGPDIVFRTIYNNRRLRQATSTLPGAWGEHGSFWQRFGYQQGIRSAARAAGGVEEGKAPASAGAFPRKATREGPSTPGWRCQARTGKGIRALKDPYPLTVSTYGVTTGSKNTPEKIASIAS